MELKTEQIFFELLRCEMNGVTLLEEIKNLITLEKLPALFKLSKQHDLVHLVADALDKNGLLPENTEARKRFLQERNMAIYRYEQIQYELEQICETLEEAKISFLPLKGSVLRTFYPEPWMRTSCDIDVLVREETLLQAIDCLKKQLRYTVGEKSLHDISLFSESGIHLELHFDLIEDFIFERDKKILENVWELSSVKEGKQYHFEMSDEAFYFYHIAHMAKHFKNGGCGVRPVLDDWILTARTDNERAREDLLRKGGLNEFAEKVHSLSDCWFNERPHNALTAEMEQYILKGGVYGNSENRAVVQQIKKGGKLRALLVRVFLPLEMLKIQYSILEKHKILLPFCQIARWFRLLFSKRFKSVKQEIQTNMSISKDAKSRTENLLRDLGL